MTVVKHDDSYAIARVAERWNLGPDDVAGIEMAVGNTRRTYGRVETLAEEVLGAEPVPAVDWTVERIGGADKYHAWMYRTEDRRTLFGPLAGERLVVKDSIAVAGVPMTLGGDFLRDFVPSKSALAVERALDAGAKLVGTAVCEDLCYSGSSFTSVTGAVLNPYDKTRSAGGSSSGCGVLLATGQADLALGTDLGGSVRNPAAWSGISALKPTFGLVPYTGAVATEFTMDHLGLMARTARDLARLLDAVAGFSDSDPRQAGVPAAARSAVETLDQDLRGLRIGIVSEGFGWPGSDPALDERVRAAAKSFADLGAEVGEASVALHKQATDIHAPISCEGGLATVFEQSTQGANHLGVYDAELAAAFGAALETGAARLPLNAKAALISGTIMRGESKGRILALAQRLRRVLRAQYDAALAEHDILVMPTCPMLPHRLPTGPLPPAEHQRLAFQMHDNNCATNLTGHPALSVPCGLIDGLPVGMLLIGRPMQDGLLLNAAHQFQTHLFACPTPPSGRAS
ncbi:MAG: amidase family protein [Candidatus Kaistia colombiensis]|nr:MAG: amidase family protein [Kaistia sp.]